MPQSPGKTLFPKINPYDDGARIHPVSQKSPDVRISIIQLDPMKTKFTYWQEDDGNFLGYLNDYPDHWTQGENLEDLKEHLRDLHESFAGEMIPGIKKVEELELA